MTFGEKLQQLRREKGLSQEQLASQLTVSRQSISKWELDSSIPDIENVVQLSRLFGVSSDYLLGLEPKSETKIPETSYYYEKTAETTASPPPPKTRKASGKTKKIIGIGAGIIVLFVVALVIFINTRPAAAINLLEQGLLAASVDKKWGFIDLSGEFVIEPQFDDVGRFSSNGLAAAKTNKLWGFINKKGEFVIYPQFDDARAFSDSDLAPVLTGTKWGYIDKSGEFVIRPQYFYALSFNSEGHAKVKNDYYHYIDKYGEPFISRPPEDDESLWSILSQNGKCGYATPNGGHAIEPEFDNARLFSSNGLAAVCLNKKWGYIDKYAYYAIKPQFAWAGSFQNDLACFIGDNDKVGYIDPDGKVIIEPQFEPFSHVATGAGNFYDDGFAVAKQDGLYGVIDKTGKFVIDPKFEKLMYRRE